MPLELGYVDTYLEMYSVNATLIFVALRYILRFILCIHTTYPGGSRDPPQFARGAPIQKQNQDNTLRKLQTWPFAVSWLAPIQRKMEKSKKYAKNQSEQEW